MVEKLHGEDAFAVADIDISIDGEAARAYLLKQHFPPGLIDLLVHQCIRSGPRYYVIDDSGSMATPDGERILHSESKPGHANHIKCSRWEELKESLRFHAGLLHAANMPCIMRFLNGPRVRFPKDGQEGLTRLLSAFDDEPSGSTPMCRHLTEIIDEIEGLAVQLRQHRRRAVIVIFSDGAASDGELVTVLCRLANLPVWLVIRLSTDEDDVVRYWSSIDNRLEVCQDDVVTPLILNI